MSLHRQIARNTVIQLIGKSFSTILGLVAIMIMTRALGVEQFGWYITAVGFLQFIGLLSDFGFTITTASMLAEQSFDKQRLLHTIFTWRFITALFFNIIAFLVIFFFPYSKEIKIAVSILTISFFAISLNQVFTGYYQYKLKMHIQTIGDLIGRIFLVTGVAIFSYLHLGFLPLMIIISIASAFNCLYLWANSGEIKFSLDAKISLALLKKIWPVALAVIFNAFYLQGDRVILPLFVSQTDVGLYGAAYRVLDIVIQLAAIAMGIMLPLLTHSWSRADYTEFKKRAQLSFDMVLLILSPMIAGVIALSKPIILFIATEKFSTASQILSILIIASLGISFGMIFGHIALAINKQKQVLWIYISDAVLSIIGYFIFIPQFGVYGAVYVTIFSEFYAGLMLFIMSTHYSHFFPSIINALKIILASTAMGLVIYLLPTKYIFISVSAGAAFYTLLVIALQIISKNTLKQLLGKKSTIIAD